MCYSNYIRIDIYSQDQAARSAPNFFLDEY